MSFGIKAPGRSLGRAKKAAPRVTEQEELDQKPLDWGLVRRMAALSKPYARTRNILLVLVLVRALQLPIISWAIAKIISGPIALGDPAGAAWSTLGFVLWVGATEVVFMYRMRLALSLGEAVVHDLRRQIYAQVLRMPISFFNEMPLGRLISRVTSDVDVVRQGIQDVFFISIVQGGAMLVAAALMLYYDWFLFLVVLAIVPILWFSMQYFRRRVQQAYRDVQETYSRVTSHLAESVNGMRVIQGFAREGHNQRRFVDLITAHAGNHMFAAQQSARFFPLVEMKSQFFIAVLLVVGGYQALHGGVRLETLLQFFFLSELFFGPIGVLGRQYNVALTAMAGAERVFALLDTEPAWEDPPDATPLVALDGRVRFEHVGFTYHGADGPALEDISFEVAAGQTVALVGETGSGKTTVTRLLSKLYLPTKGHISIDDRDVGGVDSASLHRWLGTVPQDNTLFTGSVADNIRFAKPDAGAEEITDVLERLGIADLMAGLPAGLDTEVGERGGNLSLGQRQLVCFARALIAEPRLLILDEATSSVDAATEARLQSALRRLLAGRTSFVVAHRLSTIRDADLILVLDAGRIVERGTHATLLRRGGHYTRLYREFARSHRPSSTSSESCHDVRASAG